MEGLMTTEQILQERGNDYGEYHRIAKFTNKSLEELLSLSKPSDPVFIESAHMILQKLARAFNGNVYKKDTWDDIAGYAKLASQHIDGFELGQVFEEKDDIEYL